MIKVFSSFIVLKHKKEAIISALKWKTYFINNIYFAKSNELTLSTSKSLVGFINEEDFTFSITRHRPFYQIFFPQLIAKGTITSNGNTSNIKLDFYFGLYSLIFNAFLFYVHIDALICFLKRGNYGDNFEEIFQLLFIPSIVFFMIYYEQKKIKDFFLNLL